MANSWKQIDCVGVKQLLDSFMNSEVSIPHNAVKHTKGY